MLSASVFKGHDVHKPPLTKPKIKLSALNKMQSHGQLNEVAEESSFNSTLKGVAQSSRLFIMDVSDLEDDVKTNRMPMTAQSQQTRNKQTSPGSKGPRLSSKGPQSRPSMRT